MTNYDMKFDTGSDHVFICQKEPKQICVIYPRETMIGPKGKPLLPGVVLLSKKNV